MLATGKHNLVSITTTYNLSVQSTSIGMWNEDLKLFPHHYNYYAQSDIESCCHWFLINTFVAVVILFTLSLGGHTRAQLPSCLMWSTVDCTQ